MKIKILKYDDDLNWYKNIVGKIIDIERRIIEISDIYYYDVDIDTQHKSGLIPIENTIKLSKLRKKKIKRLL